MADAAALFVATPNRSDLASSGKRHVVCHGIGECSAELHIDSPYYSLH